MGVFVSGLSAIGIIFLVFISVQACQPGIQPNYCVQFTLANYTYQPNYFGDNITFSAAVSMAKDINVGLIKAIQYDILRVVQLKGLCGRIKTGSVECFRPSGIPAQYANQTLMRVHTTLATSLNRKELSNLLSEIYHSPLPDPTFYRVYDVPTLNDVSQIGARCGCF